MLQYHNLIIGFIFYSVRDHVPKKVLNDGWEPVEVYGDGNCLFQILWKIGTHSVHVGSHEKISEVSYNKAIK